MLLEISIKTTILWTCVFVFIVTSIITLLALVKLIKLADEVYLKRLFYALILEIVAISIWGFGDAIKGGETHKNYVKITTPSPWTWNIDSVAGKRRIYITGIVFKEKENYVLEPYVLFNQQEYKCNQTTFSNEMFTSSVDIPGNVSGNLTVNVGLFENSPNDIKKLKPLIADEVVTPIVLHTSKN